MYRGEEKQLRRETLDVNAEYNLRPAIVNPPKVANFVTTANETLVTFWKLPARCATRQCHLL